MSRDLTLFLEDIVESCAKVVRFSTSLTRDELANDAMRFDAILFNLHVIGEAVKSLPMDFREMHREVAWRQIAGMRDFVAHSCFSLDMDILWSAICDDVPKLLEDVQRILDSRREP